MSGLCWANGFFKEIKDYLFFREEDGVLIVPPNRVYKLNEGGIRVLNHMYRRGRIETLPGLSPGVREEEVRLFFSNLRAFYLDASTNPDTASAVERVGYDFSFTRYPILGEIAVTYRCNNSCGFCYASCGRGATGPRRGRAAGELSTGNLKKIIRILKREAKIPFFSFTGGEPLIRPDLEGLNSFARRIGLRTNLITNGTLATRRRAAKLKASGFETAQVSVEAPSAALHDALVGRRGAFAETLSGIQNLMDAGIRVQTNTTVSGPNLPVAADMPGFLETLGVERFSMNLYIPAAAGLPHEKLFVSYDSIGDVIDTVRDEAGRRSMIFYWYSPLPHCSYNTIAKGMGNKSCAAADGLLSVSPAGDLLPCSSYDQPLGNLLAESFESIWFSPGASFFKEKKYSPDACGGCDHFVACQSACPLYWRYAGTEGIKNPRLGAVSWR